MKKDDDNFEFGFPNNIQDEPFLMKGSFAFVSKDGLFAKRNECVALLATFEPLHKDIPVVDTIVVTKEKAVATYKNEFKIIVNK